MSQHKFLSICQSENQTIADCIATFRRDIVNCEFISPYDCKVAIADMFLRAQFIHGIHDISIREQLLQSDLNTFDDIFKKAIALEISRIDNGEFPKKLNIRTSVGKSSASEIKKIRKYRCSRCDSNNSSFQHSNSRPKDCFSQKSSSRSRIDYEKIGNKPINILWIIYLFYTCLRSGKNIIITVRTCMSDRNSAVHVKHKVILQKYESTHC